MGLDQDDIKALIAILQKGLVDEDVVEAIPEQEFIQKQISPKTKPKKKQTTKNLFEQMSEYRMHKDDIAIDKKLNKFPPSQRSRNYKPVKVKCRVCGKEEKISPSLVESVERYNCNKCSTSAG